MTILGLPDIREDANFFPFRHSVPEIHKEFIKNPEEYKKRPDYLINYFYSKPDYDEPHKKLFYSTAFGLKFGAILGTLEVCSAELGQLKPSFILFAKRLSFATATFATYGAVTSVAANVRGKKDDLLNHAIAGGSVGFIYGYLHKSSAIGSIAGVACALIAMAFKQFSRSEYYIFHPDAPKLVERGTIWGNPDLRLFHHQEMKQRRQHYLFEDV